MWERQHACSVKSLFLKLQGWPDLWDVEPLQVEDLERKWICPVIHNTLCDAAPQPPKLSYLRVPDSIYADTSLSVIGQTSVSRKQSLVLISVFSVSAFVVTQQVNQLIY